jgi:hypothetical protein
MVILCDTRQQKGKHLNIERYCLENNIEMIPQCLSVRDYILPNGKIAVDTKQSVLELANDLYKDQCVFNRKYKKSWREKIKLYILVEESISCLQDLILWENKHSRIKGRYLVELMHNVQTSYGVDFVFCSKSETPKKLFELLGVKNEERKADD